jgi:alpha-glucan, water dikinase
MVLGDCRELLYLDLALESVVRQAAERGAGAAGAGAAALIGPLLQNLVLSTGNNEELCYCLKAWQGLPAAVQAGAYPTKDDALKVLLVALV